MIPLIEQNRSRIAELCRKHSVLRLDVFGSASEERGFDPSRSDIDFVVEYPPNHDLGPWLSRYFDLRRDLEMLLGRPVDVVIDPAPRNPHFIREIERTRRTVYAASGR